MLMSSLCDYSDALSLAIGTITVAGQEADAALIATDRQNKKNNN